jgi:hypothetical protein
MNLHRRSLTQMDLGSTPIFIERKVMCPMPGIGKAEQVKPLRTILSKLNGMRL